MRLTKGYDRCVSCAFALPGEDTAAETARDQIGRKTTNRRCIDRAQPARRAIPAGFIEGYQHA